MDRRGGGAAGPPGQIGGEIVEASFDFSNQRQLGSQQQQQQQQPLFGSPVSTPPSPVLCPALFNIHLLTEKAVRVVHHCRTAQCRTAQSTEIQVRCNLTQASLNTSPARSSPERSGPGDANGLRQELERRDNELHTLRMQARPDQPANPLRDSFLLALFSGPSFHSLPRQSTVLQDGQERSGRLRVSRPVLRCPAIVCRLFSTGQLPGAHNAWRPNGCHSLGFSAVLGKRSWRSDDFIGMWIPGVFSARGCARI